MRDGVSKDYKNNEAFIKARKCLSEVFNHYSFIMFDRFSSAGRTASFFLKELGPDVNAGYYNVWPYLELSAPLNIEDKTGVRDTKEKHEWERTIQDAVEKKISKIGKKPAILVWASSKVASEIAEKFDGIELAIPEQARLFLESKANLNSILRTSGVESGMIIESMRVSGHLPSYQDLKNKFGDIFVIQNSQGSGGRGTHIIRSEKDMDNIKTKSSDWKVSKFYQGASSNVTILTLPNKNGGCSIYVDIPSHKGTKSPEQGIVEGKSAGNEWGQPISKKDMQRIVAAAVKIGNYAFEKHQLEGIWGIDLILSSEGVKINEINPRLQGTTEVSAINQAQRNLPPFVAAHIVHFCGGSIDWMPKQDVFNDETIERATQKRKAPFYIKVRNTCKEQFLQKAKKGPGIYKVSKDGSGLTWLREGSSAAEADTDRDEVLIANIPSAGVKSVAGAELGTIEGMSTEKLFSEKGGLTPVGHKIVTAVKKHFGIKGP